MKKVTTIICCLALAACGWFFGNMNKSPGVQTIVAAPTFSYDLLLSQMEQRSKQTVSSVTDTIFIHDTVTVTKEKGSLVTDDFSHGKVCCDRDHYFQVKYASGDLPEIRLSPDYSFDKASIEKAKDFVSLLQFRESTLVSQGCMLVKFQNDFFRDGPDHIKPLTRKQVAQALNIHESTVSRMSAKKNSKYIQTEFGLFPVSYFYSSGVGGSEGDGNQKVSATTVKRMMEKLLADDEVKKLSDSKLAELLLQKGIKISRRTVAKYRSQLGIDNSYNR